MIMTIDNEIIGWIEKADFDCLPQALKSEFLDKVVIMRTVDNQIQFKVPCSEDAYNIEKKLKAWRKGKDSSAARQSALNLISSGQNCDEDIDLIFEAQQGLCYYTGKPLTREPKNYEIDHILPVGAGGSCWPNNIALCLREINREKGNRGKREIFQVLKNRFGAEWYEVQRNFCKEIDRKRAAIDRRRRKIIQGRLSTLERKLQDRFLDTTIEYAISDNDIELIVNDISILFPSGFIRSKGCYSPDYIGGIISSVSQSTM